MNNQEPISIIPDSNLRQGLLLFFFMLIMLLLRIVPIHHLVFTNWPGLEGNFVNFAADDAVYQMRLIHNTIQHFPHRIFFDPFAYFPLGTQIHFGPFFTLIIALAALILGLGHPSAELINIVGAYAPPIMGTLALIPTYFIARKIFNPTAAIFTAFILALLPGEFFQRSALGFTDNHVAEVLFSTTATAFLVYALAFARNFNFANKNWREILFSKPLIHAYLAGLFFGIYVLCWAPSLFFAAIFLGFFLVQLICDHWQNKEPTYLLYLAAPLYLIPALMSLPYALANLHFYFVYYSLTQPVFLLLMLAGIVVSFWLSKLLKISQSRNIFYPLALCSLLLLFILFAQIFLPTIYSYLNNGFNLLFHPSTDFRTIAEIRPGIFDANGKLTITFLWNNIFWTTRFGSLAFLVLMYRIIRYKIPGEVLLGVWTFVILMATFSELRFVYYLAINAAILSGYFIYLVLNWLLSFNPEKYFFFLIKKYAIILFTLFFALVISAPILTLALTNNLPSGPHTTKEWYEALIWLRTNTPDPQGKPIQSNFDYAKGLYKLPASSQEHFQYPASAYGVMAWWDYGHQITYIAHRIPNANPFQQGVTEEHKTGAAYFFTTQDEATAIQNLNAMGTKYILINNDMAINFFNAIKSWAQDQNDWQKFVKFERLAPLLKNQAFAIDSPKFTNSMLSKLYYQDCNNLGHFRLVYESAGKYLILAQSLNTKLAQQNSNQPIAIMLDNIDQAINVYKAAQRNFWFNKEKNIFIYAARPPVKTIKIFEKVKGATITGTAPSGTKVTLDLKLITKFKRIFTYTVATTAQNNQFAITVAYPTEKMQGQDYSYDITPLGKYQLTIAGKVQEIAVPEKAIMNGETLTIY